MLCCAGPIGTAKPLSRRVKSELAEATVFRHAVAYCPQGHWSLPRHRCAPAPDGPGGTRTSPRVRAGCRSIWKWQFGLTPRIAPCGSWPPSSLSATRRPGQYSVGARRLGTESPCDHDFAVSIAYTTPMLHDSGASGADYITALITVEVVIAGNVDHASEHNRRRGGLDSHFLFPPMLTGLRVNRIEASVGGTDIDCAVGHRRRRPNDIPDVRIAQSPPLSSTRSVDGDETIITTTIDSPVGHCQ